MEIWNIRYTMIYIWHYGVDEHSAKTRYIVVAGHRAWTCWHDHWEITLVDRGTCLRRDDIG
jgi:hypothetical protein